MRRILEILKEIRPDENFDDSSQFISEGIFDSIDIIALISEIENVFSISIDGSDIIPENFHNIRTIENLLIKYKVYS